MALRTQQSQQLSTRIAITPQLRQSIYILQLPILELKQYVERQLEENPMLEVEARQEQLPEELQESFEPEATPAVTETDQSENGTAEKWEDEWENLFGENAAESDRWDESAAHDELERQRYKESLTTSATNLRNHLLEQLRLLPLPAEASAIAQYLVGCLDDSGYLNSSVEEIAGILGVPLAQVEEALTIVQRLDPPGVGARSLQECLLLQLQSRGLSDTLAARIAREHLPALAHKHFRQIAKALRARPEAVIQAAREIQSLNPKPGAPFTAEATGYVAADVVIQHDGERYQVVASDADLPALRINHSYRALLKSGDTDPAARAYLKERMEAAMWLIKAIRQRNKTLERIGEVVLEAQREFLDHGPGLLKPLTFRDVALKVGVHESTRRIRNCPVAGPPLCN